MKKSVSSERVNNNSPTLHNNDIKITHIYTYKFATTFTNKFFLITQHINLAVSQSNRSPTQYSALRDSWVYPTRPV